MGAAVLAVACDRAAETPAKTDAPAVEVFKEVGRSLDEIGERITKTGEPAKATEDVESSTESPEQVLAEEKEVSLGEEKPAPHAIPIAELAPGQPGYIISPYSGKVIDVRGIPAMTLVQDPEYPAAEKKYFRVPEMPDMIEEPAPGTAPPADQAEL